MGPLFRPTVPDTPLPRNLHNRHGKKLRPIFENGIFENGVIGKPGPGWTTYKSCTCAAFAAFVGGVTGTGRRPGSCGDAGIWEPCTPPANHTPPPAGPIPYQTPVLLVRATARPSPFPWKMCLGGTHPAPPPPGGRAHYPPPGARPRPAQPGPIGAAPPWVGLWVQQHTSTNNGTTARVTARSAADRISAHMVLPSRPGLAGARYLSTGYVYLAPHTSARATGPLPNNAYGRPCSPMGTRA